MKIAVIWSMLWRIRFIRTSLELKKKKPQIYCIFMIKDHPYVDGCKRIAASLFLEFLDKNNALFQDGEKRLSDGTLVAVTLMIAESNPEEKEVMVKLVMNLLNLQ